MKKLFTFVFFLFFSLFPFFKVTAVDFTKTDLKASVCAVENSDLFELKKYLNKDVLENQDKKEIEKIIAKIRKAKNVCFQKLSLIKHIDEVFPIINNQELDSCLAVGNLEEKNSHYLNLLRFDQEELNKKGYENEQQIEKVIEIVNAEIKKIRPLCQTKKQLAGFPHPLSAIEPTAMLNYYKNQTAKLSNNFGIGKNFIDNFKNLTQIVDLSVYEYLVNNNEFEMEKILPIISTMTFEKGLIKFDDQILNSSEEKIFDYNIDNLQTKIISNGLESKIQSGKTTVYFETAVQVELEGIFINNQNISKALEIFLKNKYEKLGTFSLFTAPENSIFLIGKSIKKGRLLGIIPKEAPIYQDYLWKNDEFILQEQNRPWWYWLVF